MFVDREVSKEKLGSVCRSFLEAATIYGTLSPIQWIPEYQELVAYGEVAISPILDIIQQEREEAAPLLFVLFNMTRLIGMEQPELTLFDPNVSITAVIDIWIKWGKESGRIQDTDMIH